MSLLALCVCIGIALLLIGELYLLGLNTNHDRLTAWAIWAVVLLVVIGTGLLGLFAGLVSLGGIAVVYRNHCEEHGLPYVQFKVRERITGQMVLAVRRLIRPKAGLRPGEVVEVRSLPEILATLDENGCCDGMPFMPEMIGFCGHRFPVHRRVEKVWEYGHGTGNRRIRDAVLLSGLRCDGQSHGGCQSGCPAIWKEAWLKLPGTPSGPTTDSSQQLDLKSKTQLSVDGRQRYVCQMTEIRNASTQLNTRDIGHYWRDALSGNVRIVPLLVEIGVRLFNSMQWRLGGLVWPVLRPSASGPTPYQDLHLQPGQLVRVKSKHEIMQTLNSRQQNRGLHFGADMLAYCGGSYRVAARISRCVHEGTGEMLEFKTPSILLEGVTGIGGAIMNPVNENYFWREVWLEPQPPGAVSHSAEAVGPTRDAR